MESIVKQTAEAVGLACELITVLLVALGAAEAVVRTLRNWRSYGDYAVIKAIWLGFAARILLALEFALAADIASTAVAPTWEDIGQLAAIAAIRTALNWFLERDLEAARREGRASA